MAFTHTSHGQSEPASYEDCGKGSFVVYTNNVDYSYSIDGGNNWYKITGLATFYMLFENVHFLIDDTADVTVIDIPSGCIGDIKY